MSSIQIQKNNIVYMDTDCIVNAANSYLLAGVGVCGAIFLKWQGGHCQEKQLLYSCYQKALQLALKNYCHSIAFP